MKIVWTIVFWVIWIGFIIGGIMLSGVMATAFKDWGAHVTVKALIGIYTVTTLLLAGLGGWFLLWFNQKFKLNL